MSGSNVVVISSDEDSSSSKVSEESETIHATDTAQNSNYNEENDEWDDNVSEETSNETESSTNSESGNSDSETVEDVELPNGTEIIENNIYDYGTISYQEFVALAVSLEHEEIIKEKISNKLLKYYNCADPDYVNSDEFQDLLRKSVSKIKMNSVYLYFVLREVKDVLIANRATFNFVPSPKNETLSSGEQNGEGTSAGNDLADEEFDEERSKIITKLIILLRKLENKIKELEEMEVDFSDEEDSSYFKMQRYRARYCQVYKKFCAYAEQPDDANRISIASKINFSDTDNLELNRAIEKWLNDTRRFPDFSEVHKLIIELNESLNLRLNKEQIKIRAEQIFESIGNMLQRRRYFDFWDSMSSYLDTHVDPAVTDPELESVLQQNYDTGLQKERELIRYYVEKQEKEKLQPREVPDEEANCSPAESSDEDEKEIENTEISLDSNISTDDVADELTSEEEDCQSSISSPDSEPVEEVSSKTDIYPGTSYDREGSPSSSDSFMIIGRVCRKALVSRYLRANSTMIEDVGTSDRKISPKDENAFGLTPNKDKPVSSGSKNLIKRKNESDDDDENINAGSSEGKGTGEERKSFKKSKLIRKSDSDSDCEIIEITPDKKDKNSPGRKVYQINYAFINNNFNYNTILSNNIFGKRNGFQSNYKTTKNQLSHILPFKDITNIKNIFNKFVQYRENKMKGKPKNGLCKPKVINTNIHQPLKGYYAKLNNLPISLAKNSINCALQQGTTGGNMKSQKGQGNINKKKDLQQGSSDKSARLPANGSSSGGNGEDNSGNNGNKKPFDHGKENEDNQENEDKEENEEESGDSSENTQPGTSEATSAAPKVPCSGTKTYQNVQQNLGTRQFKLPSTEKTAKIEKKVGKKQVEKPLAKAGNLGRGEMFQFCPLPGTPKAQIPLPRKRKVNKNGGRQSTCRQGNLNTSAAKAKKVPATPMKRDVNKAVATPKRSKDEDIEIIQVTKKKRSTPVKAVQSDEEIVKNFLERSNPSISITTPKKRNVQKEPPASVLQALETLRRLKGISTTIVKGSSKSKTDDDVTVIGESLNTRVSQISKLKRTPKSSTTATKILDSSSTTTTKLLDPSSTTATKLLDSSSTTATTLLDSSSTTATTFLGSSNATATFLAPPNATATTFLVSPNATATFLGPPNATATFLAPPNATATFLGSPNATATFLGPPNATATFLGPPNPTATTFLGSSNATATTFLDSSNTTGTTFLDSSNTTGTTFLDWSNTTEAMGVEPFLPKIVTVQGNVSGFDEMTNEGTIIEQNFYPLPLCVQSPQTNLTQHVSGSVTNYEDNLAGMGETIPIPRFRNVRSRSRRTPKNKTKNVEYVILD